MKDKTTFIFGARNEDLQGLVAINEVLSTACDVKNAGYHRCFRFALHCAQEYLANKAITYEQTQGGRCPHRSKVKNIFIRFGHYDIARLATVKKGLDAIADDDLSRSRVLRLSLHCAGAWLDKNLKEGVNDSQHATRVMSALVFCSQSGACIGPTKFVSSALWLENTALPEHDGKTA